MNQPLTRLDERRAAIESKIDTGRTSDMMLSGASGGLMFRNVGEAMEAAKLMALSDKAVRPHLRNNPGACFGIVIQAVEWGMSPYAVGNKSYLVNDQFAYESQLIQAVILRRAPLQDQLINFEYLGEGGKRRCLAWATTLSGKRVEYLSPEFDKVHPKNSPLWKSDPDMQFSYYSGRGLCRKHFPHVLLGVYAADELVPMRDVTPPAGSGLAERLQGANGGFNAEGVESALAEAVEGDSGSEAVVDHSGPETPADDLRSQAYDQDAVRAGSTACVDGEAREAPDDFTPEQAAGWLYGYDQTAAAIGGQ